MWEFDKVHCKWGSQRTQIPGNKLLSAPPTLWSTANPKYWSISQPKMHWSSEMHLYGCFRHYQITRKSIPMSLLQKKQSTILRTQFLFKLSQNAMHINMKNMISRMKTLDILFMCSGGWRGGGRGRKEDKKRKGGIISFSTSSLWAMRVCMAPSQYIMMRVHWPAPTSVCWWGSLLGEEALLSLPSLSLSPSLSHHYHWCLCLVTRWRDAQKPWLQMAHH